MRARAKQRQEQPSDSLTTLGRLHLQHELTKTNFDGNLLDPSIPTDNPDLRIADVACGTGVWALDLADRVPESVKIDCLDINFDEAPPEAWLPGNVRYQQCDLREPIREDLLGQYDILHVRYIVMFVLDPDFQIILAKLMSMLSVSVRFRDLLTGMLIHSTQSLADTSNGLIATAASLAGGPEITTKMCPNYASSLS